jgi:sigma-B regulation protein RsbU (phosphoserine phosphatase)
MVTAQFSPRSSDAVEAERLWALERYSILDTPRDDVFDRITRAAAAFR